eukprot:4962786-Pleurochrysis_carterae.AAC.2
MRYECRSVQPHLDPILKSDTPHQASHPLPCPSIHPTYELAPVRSMSSTQRRASADPASFRGPRSSAARTGGARPRRAARVRVD